MYRDAATIRDALVSILVIYVVMGLIFSPLQKLNETEKFEEDIHPIMPTDGFYHHNQTVLFEWTSATEMYIVTIENETETLLEEEIYETSSYKTKRLNADNYTYQIEFKSMNGVDLQVVQSGNFSLESPSKQTFEWERVPITYDIAIYDGAVLFKEINDIETNDTYVDGFENGVSYTWHVKANDGKGTSSEWSTSYSVNVGTTHFLALELFNNWQMSFVLIGMILVIALVGGVFLARREEDD